MYIWLLILIVVIALLIAYYYSNEIKSAGFTGGGLLDWFRKRKDVNEEWAEFTEFVVQFGQDPSITKINPVQFNKPSWGNLFSKQNNVPDDSFYSNWNYLLKMKIQVPVDGQYKSLSDAYEYLILRGFEVDRSGHASNITALHNQFTNKRNLSPDCGHKLLGNYSSYDSAYWIVMMHCDFDGDLLSKIINSKFQDKFFARYKEKITKDAVNWMISNKKFEDLKILYKYGNIRGYEGTLIKKHLRELDLEFVTILLEIPGADTLIINNFTSLKRDAPIFVYDKLVGKGKKFPANEDMLIKFILGDNLEYAQSVYNEGVRLTKVPRAVSFGMLSEEMITWVLLISKNASDREHILIGCIRKDMMECAKKAHDDGIKLKTSIVINKIKDEMLVWMGTITENDKFKHEILHKLITRGNVENVKHVYESGAKNIDISDTDIRLITIEMFDWLLSTGYKFQNVFKQLLDVYKHHNLSDSERINLFILTQWYLNNGIRPTQEELGEMLIFPGNRGREMFEFCHKMIPNLRIESIKYNGKDMPISEFIANHIHQFGYKFEYFTKLGYTLTTEHYIKLWQQTRDRN